MTAPPLLVDIEAPERELGAAAILLTGCAALLIAMRQSFTVPFTGLGQSPAQLLALAAAACWILTRLVGQRGVGGQRALRLVIGAQLVAAVASYAAGMLLPHDSDQLTSADRSLLIQCTLSLFALFIFEALRTRRQIETVLQALVLAGALSAIFAILQSIAHVDLAASFRPPGLRVTESTLSSQLREGLLRPQGSAAHPLELGAIMTALIPLGLGLTMSARRQGRPPWLWVAATALIAGGAAVSLSRSAAVGVLAALVVMVPHWPIRRLATVAAAVAAMAAAAFLSGSRVASALFALFSSGSHDYSLESRAEGRSYVSANFARHLWLGQGLGTYQIPRQPVLDNQYLDQLMESGLIGLILLIAVLVTAFVLAIRAVGHQLDPAAAELASAIAGSLAAVLVTYAILDASGFVQISTLTWLLVGLSGAVWRLREPVLAGGADQQIKVDHVATQGRVIQRAP